MGAGVGSSGGGGGGGRGGRGGAKRGRRGRGGEKGGRPEKADGPVKIRIAMERDLFGFAEDRWGQKLEPNDPFDDETALGWDEWAQYAVEAQAINRARQHDARHFGNPGPSSPSLLHISLNVPLSTHSARRVTRDSPRQEPGTLPPSQHHRASETRNSELFRGVGARRTTEHQGFGRCGGGGG